MGVKRHANHGRDHAATGSDPIPGFAAAADPVYMPGSRMFNAAAIFASHSSNNSGNVIFDVTVPNNLYTSNTSSSNDPFIYIPVWFGKADGTYGPDKGSTSGLYWCHHIVRSGPDCGKLVLEVASATVSGVVHSVFSGSLTWIQILTDDLYVVLSTWGYPYSSSTINWRTWYIRLTGAVGAQASAYVSTSDGGLDGGPGLYYFRYKKNGKNASSSAYKIDMAQFGVSGLAG